MQIYILLIIFGIFCNIIYIIIRECHCLFVQILLSFYKRWYLLSFIYHCLLLNITCNHSTIFHCLTITMRMAFWNTNIQIIKLDSCHQWQQIGHLQFYFNKFRFLLVGNDLKLDINTLFFPNLENTLREIFKFHEPSLSYYQPLIILFLFKILIWFNNQISKQINFQSTLDIISEFLTSTHTYNL